MDNLLLKVEGLCKHFPIRQGNIFQKQASVVHAVDGISFGIYQGTTLGLVGESGSGKSTTGRTIIQLYRPTAGTIFFNGIDLTRAKPHELQQIRRNIQMVFQDPFASLNPRMTVGQIISEPIVIYEDLKKYEVKEWVFDLLQLVGLDPSCANRYPHEFSGGQRQRIGIARALALRPSLVICDEPLSALDVSIQAQISNLLCELQEEFGLTYLYISHDLTMVHYLCDRTAVMYLGEIVEMANTDELFENPLHPYTRALLSSIVTPNISENKNRKLITLAGEIPSPINLPLGCRFSTRCPVARSICFDVPPEFIEKARGHFVSCHLA